MDHVVVVTALERHSVPVAEQREVSSLEREAPDQRLDRTHVVGHTLQVVAGEQHLVHVPVQLSTTVLDQSELVTTQEERIVHHEVVVVCVQANILGVVVEVLLGVEVVVVVHRVGSGVVSVHDVVLAVAIETELGIVQLLVVDGADHIGVEEVVRVDLVDGWQNDALQVRSVHHGQVQHVDEHTLVDVVTGPDHVLVVRVPVGAVVQEGEHSVGLAQVLLVVDGEELALL